MRPPYLDWPDYLAAACDEFTELTGLSADRVPTKVWRDCFIRSLPPNEAASAAETRYVNNLKERDRLAYYKRKDERRSSAPTRPKEPRP